MTHQAEHDAELAVLIDAAYNNTATPEQLRQLELRLRGNRQACRQYLLAFRLDSELRFLLQAKASCKCEQDTQDLSNAESSTDVAVTDQHDLAAKLEPPILLDVSTTHRANVPWFASAGVISYAAALLFVVIGLLIGSIYYLPPYSDSRERHTARNESKAEPEIVGHIAGVADCQWAETAGNAAANDVVRVGQKYELVAGSLEILYTSGAAVLLQGPCSFEVDSSVGGYLSLGKITAKVEKPFASGSDDKVSGLSEERAASRKSTVAVATRDAAQALFSIRTPTAIVIDKGTEFAVEVDRSQTSHAYVFRGQVEVCAVDATGAEPQKITLRENESARVQNDQKNGRLIVRDSWRPKPSALVRRMPQYVRIPLFKTGEGLKVGDRDPHWQVVARSDDPNFKPQPAVVIRADSVHRVANYDSRGMWPISLSEGPLPNGVRYTFRTTFDLTGLVPNTASINGSILADDAVVAIRVNGHDLIAPTQKAVPTEADHVRFHIAETNLVPGINVLEIDVLNGGNGDDASAKGGIMACDVPWEGWAWQSATTDAARKPAANEK